MLHKLANKDWELLYTSGHHSIWLLVLATGIYFIYIYACPHIYLPIIQANATLLAGICHTSGSFFQRDFCNNVPSVMLFLPLPDVS